MRRGPGDSLQSERGRRAKRWINPVGLFGVIFAGLALIQFAALAHANLVPNVAVAWLLALSLTAVIAFVYDKAISGRGVLRVPEKVLLAIVLFGGSPGALLAMGLVRHKTAKSSFLLRLALILVLQAAVVAVYIFVVR